MFRILTNQFVLLVILMIIGSPVLAQNVGIGTSVPAQKLHVAGVGQTIRVDGLAGVGNRTVYANVNGDLTVTPVGLVPNWLIIGNAGTNPAANFIGSIDNVDFRIRTFNSERITVKNNGWIGVHTNAPLSYLQVVPPVLAGNFQFMWDNNLNGDAPARFQNSVTTNGNRCFLGVTNYNASAFAATAVMGLALNGTNTTPALAGAEGVRGSNNSVSGIGVIGTFVGGNTAVIGWAVYAAGWAGGTTPWITVSDARLKKNVKTLTDALEKIKQVRGVEYNFDTEAYPNLTLTHDKQIGFIAQELEQIFPSMIHEKGVPYDRKIEDGGNSATSGSYLLKAVSYTDMIPVLVEGIKDQQKLIEDLQSRIKLLEEKK